jgi:RNase P/RNase MRP subunit p30
MKTDLAWIGWSGPGFDRVLVLGSDVKIMASEASARREKGLLDTPDYKLKRRCVERRWVDGIISLGIDDVLARFMAENGVAYVVLFSRLLSSENQAEVMATILRDIRLCRKYKVRVRIGSGAEKKDCLRSAEVLISFLESLGLERNLARGGVE